MVSYLGWLVQFSPAAGRAGRCRQTSLCMDSTPCVLATLGLPRTRVSVLSRLHCSGFRLLYMEQALRCVRFQLSGTPQKRGFGCAFLGLSGSGSQRPRAHFPRVRRAFSLRGPSAHRRWGLRKSLDRYQGPVCRVGGGGFSGAEFAPFPSPLPPTSSGDGPAPLCSFSVPLFCEPPAVCSGLLIFPCCPTV